MEGEDRDAARQAREQRIVLRRIEEVDVVDAELAAAPGDVRAERVCEKLRAEADSKARQTAPHGIAKLAACVERDVVDTETAAEHDRAVEFVDGRESVRAF